MNSTEIFPDYKTFTQRPDILTNGVCPLHAKTHPNYVADNLSNVGCWNCVECENCKECVRCLQCTECDAVTDSRECRDCYYCDEIYNMAGAKYEFKQ